MLTAAHRTGRMGVHAAILAPPGATRSRGAHQRVGREDKPAPAGRKHDGGGLRPEGIAKLGVEGEDPLVVATIGGDVGQFDEPDEGGGTGLVTWRPEGLRGETGRLFGEAAEAPDRHRRLQRGPRPKREPEPEPEPEPEQPEQETGSPRRPPPPCGHTSVPAARRRLPQRAT